MKVNLLNLQSRLAARLIVGVFLFGVVSGGRVSAEEESTKDKTVTETKEIAKTAKENLQESAAVANQKRKEMVRSMESELDKMSDEIKALRKKSKAETKELVERLESEQKVVRRQLAKLKASSSDTFDRVEAATKKLWSGLKDSVKAAKKELEK